MVKELDNRTGTTRSIDIRGTERNQIYLARLLLERRFISYYIRLGLQDLWKMSVAAIVGSL